MASRRWYVIFIEALAGTFAKSRIITFPSCRSIAAFSLPHVSASQARSSIQLRFISTFQESAALLCWYLGIALPSLLIIYDSGHMHMVPSSPHYFYYTSNKASIVNFSYRRHFCSSQFRLVRDDRQTFSSQMAIDRCADDGAGWWYDE